MRELSWFGWQWKDGKNKHTIIRVYELVILERGVMIVLPSSHGRLLGSMRLEQDKIRRVAPIG